LECVCIKPFGIDSSWVFGWFLGSKLETARGNHKMAKEYTDKYMSITGTSPEWFYAYTLQQLGKTDSAAVILAEELKDYSQYLDKSNHIQVFNYMAFSEIHALLNDKGNAFKWWRKAVDEGFTEISRITGYPYLASLKNDVRYNNLLNYMQANIDSFQTEAKNKYPEYFDCD
jgi:hypothetical protein